MKITLGGHTYEIGHIEYGSYATSRDVPSMVLWDTLGEPIATATINLAAYGLYPGAGKAFVKDYAEGEGMADELERLGLVEKIRRFEVGEYGSGTWLVRLIRGASPTA